MSDTRDDLTALANLADAIAREIITRCPPEEWSGNPVTAGLRATARRLRAAGRALPASVVEVIERGRG